LVDVIKKNNRSSCIYWARCGKIGN
jgi:hypothetical protein